MKLVPGAVATGSVGQLFLEVFRVPTSVGLLPREKGSARVGTLNARQLRRHFISLDTSDVL